jgi:O-antigen ligase
MLKDYWKGGAGVGSFRFLFPTYQHRYPKLTDAPQYWEHAHNDILEIPIELGIVGVLIVAISTGYLLLALTRSFFWENPLSGCTVLGTSLLVVYSWWDFPLQCPAILITCCTLGVAITSWTKLEEMNVRG